MNILSLNKYVFNYALSLHVYTFMMVVSISFRCNFSHSDSDTSFWLVMLEFIFFVRFCFRAVPTETEGIMNRGRDRKAGPSCSKKCR